MPPDDPSLPTWLTAFNAGSPVHWATVAACAVVVTGACVLGARWRGTRREPTLRWAWVGFIIVWQIFDKTWWIVVHGWDPAQSLPLHLCDLAAVLAPFALVLQTRWLRAVLYFWAIGLSTQAFFTPTLDPQSGLLTTRYWLFWMGHVQIVGSAVYDVIVLRFRPGGRDYVYGTIANVVYGAAILPIDVIFDLNYGYLGRHRPERGTLLDLMPEWPWRLVAIFVLVQAVMAVLWLVWPVSRAIGRRLRAGDDRLDGRE